MNTKNTLKIGILFISLIIASCSPKLYYKSVKKQSQCNTKKGYWYKDKCWKDYEDEGISKKDIDSIVDQQLVEAKKAKISIADKQYPVTLFMPEIDGKELSIFILFNKDDKTQTILIPNIDYKSIKNNKTIDNQVFVLFDINLSDDSQYNKDNINEHLIGGGKLKIVISDYDKLLLKCDGEMSFKDKVPHPISITLNDAVMGKGTSELKVDGELAYLSGDLGTITYKQVKNLIQNHPEVKTIVMTKISGSLNDAVNMHTGRILHENGFTTKVLSNSDIASGGVDLFCAGVNRIVEKGAKIGIHSWCCVDDIPANKLPKDHPAHQYQLEYFTMCLGKDLGPKFYFKTLEVASADSIYYMKDDEIKEWKIATEFIENE